MNLARFGALTVICQKDLSIVQDLTTLQLTAKLVSVTRSKKEVFQPHLPVRLPCYDLAPVTSFALGRSLRSRTSGTPSFHGAVNTFPGLVHTARQAMEAGGA